MKFNTISCPNCGSLLKFEKKEPICFCSYCGASLEVDDGVKRTEHTYRDITKGRARVKKATTKREFRNIATDRESKKS